MDYNKSPTKVQQFLDISKKNRLEERFFGVECRV